MCGLVGLFSMNITAEEQKAMQHLLYMDTIRGWDSTGVMYVNATTGDVDVYKKAIPGCDFVFLGKYLAMMKTSLSTKGILMGHNRAATRGGVSAATAHPFEQGGVVLAHNGTLDSHRTLGGGNTFTVDSEAIAWAISESNDAKEVIEELDGAFALTWYDSDDDTFNMCRNEERPLHVIEILNTQGNAKGIMWASEVWMLQAVVARCKYMSFGKTITKLKVGTLVSYDVSNDFACVRTEAVKLVEKKSWDYNNNNYYSTGRKGRKNHRTSGTTTHGQSQSGGNTTGQVSSRTLPKTDTGTNGTTPPRKTGINSRSAPDLGEYIDFEIDMESFTKYTGANEDGFCSGYAYGEDVLYNVRFSSCNASNTTSGVWRGRITSTSLLTKETPQGESDMLLYVSRASSAKVDSKEPRTFVKGNAGNRSAVVINTPKQEESKALVVVKSNTKKEDAVAEAETSAQMYGPKVGELITLAEWDSLTKHGCAVCSCNLYPSQHLSLLWVDRNTPVCRSCQNSSDRTIN